MTIADKITTLNGIKQDIKAAIEAKGVTVGNAPFGDYDTKISQITGGGGGMSYPTTIVPTWDRPADWLAMPTIDPTENKVAILVAVFPNGGQPNKVALQIDTIGYTVDWGDGDVTTHTGSTQAEHTYDFTDAALDGTLTTAGYKQAMIVMTPTTAGQNIPVVRFMQKYTGAPAGAVPTNFLDILMSAPSCAYASLGSASPTVRHHWLQRFRMLSGALNDVNGFARDTCNNMVVCELPTITLSLNASNMFYRCMNLREITLNCSTLTSTLYMFYDCYSLVKATLTSTAASTNTSSMFAQCYSLKEVTGIDTTASTSTNNMFANCGNLLQVEFLGNNTTTAYDATNMFTNCVALREIKGLNLSKANNCNNTFLYCCALISLKDVPGPTSITNIGGWDSTFRECGALFDVFDIVKGSATNFNHTFRYCTSLQTINIDTTAGVTSMDNTFSYCASLSSLNITTFDTASVTVFNPNISNAGFMAGCGMLRDITIDCTALTGPAPNFSMSGFPRSSAPVVKGAAPGGTITLTNSGSVTKLEPYTSYGIFNLNYNVEEFIMSSANGINADINASNLAKSNTQYGKLRRVVMPNMKFTFSVAYNSMSAVAIDEMFTNLGTVTGKTVTVTGNPGAAYCDPTIATAKGWTVVQ